MLTVLSLAIMVALVLPVLSQGTEHLLEVYDKVICFVFLFDFALRLSRAEHKRDYFVGERGWLDLIGSIIGALASILASVLVPQPDDAARSGSGAPSERTAATPELARELSEIRSELVALRRSIATGGGEPGGS